jgi:lipid A 3-O-deacylase
MGAIRTGYERLVKTCAPQPRRMTNGRRVLECFGLGMTLLLGFFPGVLCGEDLMRLDSAGARFGVALGKRTGGFRQSEAFVFWNLPWGAQVNPEWHLQWRADLSLGWLTGGNDRVAIGTMGGSLVLRRQALPFSLELGFSPTLMSGSEVGDQDFGTIVQFTSHAGFNFDLNHKLSVGYRVQHMSNAHLDNENPGLNLHMLAVSWRF